MLISVLKEYKIKKIIASPGTTNFPFVYSVQKDDYFEVYSCVDERSAAYMACGLSAESHEPVVITCTGATASRNYLPGLTEAFYRKLPILVIAGTDGDFNVGHLVSQILDRSVTPKDAIKYSVSLQNIVGNNDEWINNIKINSAISELYRHGSGPVLITIQTNNAPFVTGEMPKCRIIKRINNDSERWPSLDNKKVAIFIGAHEDFTPEDTVLIDNFCESNNAFVFCDHTSGYHGNYRINYTLVASQLYYEPLYLSPEILIHIGEISGEYYITRKLHPRNVWRVSEDGEMRDKFRSLQFVFEMKESVFFKHYINDNCKVTNYISIKEECKNIEGKIKELPFSNIWIAKKLHSLLPLKSTIHFGILNSLRSWNFFELDSTISTSCNVGGFGIDGTVSTLNGASLYDRTKSYFAILGDLAFFYDLNSICNRNVNRNMRIMVINNGHGQEFSNYDHPASKLGEEVDKFVAAGGHNGAKSPILLKNYSEGLGFRYISASSKEEFENVYEKFINSEMTDSPILFEIFTNPSDENKALEIMHLTLIDDNIRRKLLLRKSLSQVKQTIKKIL